MNVHWSWSACVVVATLLVAGTACFAAPASAQEPPADGISADSVIVMIDVRTDGSAVWSIQYRFRLDSPNRTHGFERFRSRVDAQRSAYVASVRSDVDTTVAIAENETGRSMSLSNVSVETSRQTIPHDVSVVRHRFVWHGFAAANETHVSVGDAIRGFALGPDTELVVSWPGEYRPEGLDPSPTTTDGGEATWEDPAFNVEEPRFVFAKRSTGPTLPLVAGFGVAFLALGLVAAAYVRRTGSGRRGLRARLESVAVRSLDDDAVADEPGESPADSPADHSVDDGDADEPSEPLSNAERVVWVLESHGGRVKQQTLAEECDWSDSKTSRVVQRLHDEGRIDRFRLGRENVVSLPEVDHDDV